MSLKQFLEDVFHRSRSRDLQSKDYGSEIQRLKDDARTLLKRLFRCHHETPAAAAEVAEVALVGEALVDMAALPAAAG